MKIRNKVLVTMFLEDGQVSFHWRLVNFDIYSHLFQEMIQDAAADWIADHEIKTNTLHEVIFAHVVERDPAGVVTSEFFEPIYHEFQSF